MIFNKTDNLTRQADIDGRLPKLFSALSDKRRFEMVKLLNKRADLCVSQIAKSFGITVSAASQQLKLLELAGLVRPVRMGQKICYEIKSEDLLVRQLVFLLRQYE